MAFDAGSVESSLTIDTSKFDADMARAEARVKAFEDARHEVKVSAVFDQSSLSRARTAFSQLDNAISKDAMSRLRSSPQGSVLGALNALFSPHPVTGAPSPQQAAQQGLLGKMISSPGGGGPTGTGSSGTAGPSPLAQALGQNANTTGKTPQNVTTSDQIKQMITGQGPKDTTTTDTIKQNVTGKGPSDTTTTDTVKEKIDPASAAKAEGDAKASGDRAGGGWFASFTGHLKNLLPASSTDKAVKDAGTAGSKGGAALGSGLLGGIGPGILGVSAKVSSIVGLVGSALGALPALAGVIGLGLGATLIGGMVAGAVAGSAELKTQFKNIGGEAKTMFAAAAAPIIPALHDVLAQVPALIKQLQAPLTGIFKTIAPQMQGIFAGLIPVITGLVKVMQAAAPAFGPFIMALEGLVSNILPGIETVIKATIPFVTQFAGILGTLGKNLGGLFAAAAPAIGASMQILSGLLGLVGDLLPVIMNIADLFAKTLAPVFTTFASVIGTLTPVLVLVGQVIAQFAGAVLGDLASAFGAVATLAKGLAPSLTILAATFGSIFTILENTGVFATFGDALENLAVPLANLVNALVTGLAPVLPVLTAAVSQLVTVAIDVLSVSLGAVLTALTPVVSALATAVTAVVGFLQSTGLLLPVMAALVLTVGPIAAGLKAMAAGMAAFAGSAMSGAIGGMIGSLKEFALATEGVTLAEKAQYAEMLLMDAITPFGWAVIAAVTLGAVVFGLEQMSSGIGATVSALAKQDDAVGYNIAGYQKLAAQTKALGDQQAQTAASIGTSAAKGAGVVKGVVAGNAAAFSAVSAATAALADNMASRLAALSGSFGVSQTQIEKWASAAGISAAKFGGAGENVGKLTAAIVDFVNKNPQAVLAASSTATQLAIFGNDAFNATTQLDAFNSIWNTLVGNLLSKQEAVTNSDSAFSNLTQTIANSGSKSDAAKQSFQQYIQQIGSSASTLLQNGASIDSVNGYLQTQIGNLESLHNLSPGEKQDLADLKALQDDLANSVKGLNDAQKTLITQFEASLIPDLQQMAADTPAVKTDISNLADSIIQTGNNSASTAGDRAQLIKDLENAGLTAQEATAFVKGLQGSIDNLKGKVVTVGVTATAQGTLNAISHLAGQNPSTSILTLSTAANGMLVSGGVAGKDSVLAMLMPGEVVVPTAMVQGGAVDHLRGSIPGFASGGMVNLDAPGSWAAGAEGTWGTAVADAWAQASKAAFTAAAAAAAAAGTPVAYNKVAGVTQWESDVSQVLAMLGLPAADLPTVMSQMLTESGGNPNAINLTDSNAAAGTPSKGLMQVIAGTFAAYRSPSLSSNIYDPLANIYAGLNYAVHEYGNPGWLSVLGHGHGYANGGMITEPVIGRGMNSGDRYVLGESGSEMVTPVGGSHGGTSMDDLAALLRELNGHMRQQIAVTRQIPAGVGDSVGGAIGGAAHAASFRSRYPRGGSG